MITLQESLEFCDYFYRQSRDNLFSADHRSKMVCKYGYTEAMNVSVGELNDGKPVSESFNRLKA